MESTKRLKNKVALVTGSDSGIGKAIAKAYVEEGASVIICYHSDRERALEVKKELRSKGGNVLLVKLDVTNETNVKAAFDKALKKFGSVDILVNNAGVNGSKTPIADMKSKIFDKCLKTNLYGPFYCCKTYVKLRKGESNGKIINVSSIHEEVVTPGNTEYAASKGALKNLMKGLALELAKQNIQVNNIAPGMILTNMNQESVDNIKIRRKKEKDIPINRAGEAKEIADAAVFLASSDSNYITGSTIIVDGGLSISLTSD